MLRRSLIIAALGGAVLVTHARAQENQGAEGDAAPALIEPQNALEFAFVSALTNENMRPVFRRYLLDTHVALALVGAGDDAAPLEVDVRDDFRAVAIFTSAARVDAVLGAETPRVILNGRAALERAQGKNVVINYRLVPMLTLEPEDVGQYLETPGESSAGPTQ